jgi:hypothetical protein
VPPTQCPQCGDRVAAGSDFCANGHYLGWDKTQLGMAPVQQQPVQQQVQRQAPPPVVTGYPTGPNTPLPPQEAVQQPPAGREDIAANPIPSGPVVTCHNCGEVNAQSRTYCQRCGEKLGAPQPQPVQYLPPPPVQESRFPARVVVTVVLALALIAGGVVFALSRSGDKDPATNSAAKTQTPTSTVDPTSAAPTTQATQQSTQQQTTEQQPQRIKVDRSTMTAKASSTLAPQNGRDYKVGNVLDGNADTAWNSDGDKVGNGVGQQLTFTFARPTHLVRLDFINGYARNHTLFKENGRIRLIKITTAAGTFDGELADRETVQSLSQDFGTTTSVSITVVSIYPGSKYQDLGLTEAGFVELR